MAKYNVIFTVRDKYGKDKEIEGGTVEIDLPTLTKEEITYITQNLPLEDYLKKEEIDAELDHFATDIELEEAIKKDNSFSYSDFEFND